MSTWRAAGYYSILEPPRFDRDEPIFRRPLDLGMDAPVGEIVYTLDGSDPRTSRGAVSETAQRDSGPVPVSHAAHVRTRARNEE